MITQDEYFTVINTEATYTGIAKVLKEKGSIVFAWTDGESTQLDILMSYHPPQFGYLQRGMKTHTDIFVAVSMHGMFGFEINEKWKAPSYVGEKLNLGVEPNDTTEALSKLINGVISCLTRSK